MNAPELTWKQTAPGTWQCAHFELRVKLGSTLAFENGCFVASFATLEAAKRYVVCRMGLLVTP